MKWKPPFRGHSRTLAQATPLTVPLSEFLGPPVVPRPRPANRPPVQARWTPEDAALRIVFVALGLPRALKLRLRLPVMRHAEALDSARSLYAFRPTEAPRGREGPELQHPGRGVFSIQQLVEAAAEVQLFSQSGWLDAATEQEMVEKVKATQAKARAEQMENTGSGAPHPQMRARTLREAHLSPSRRRPGKPLDGGRDSAAGRRLRPNGNNGPAAGGGLTAGR